MVDSNTLIACTVDWSVTGGTFTRLSDTAITYTAPDAVGDMTVTATLRGTSTTSSSSVRVFDSRLSGETRFLLSWGAAPRDLDTHLWLPASTPYHVYYGRRGSDSTCPFAQLDQDVTSGFGPEIMRVKRLTGLTVPATGSGRWWNVLRFDAATGEITPINTLGDGFEPYFDTDSGCSQLTGQSQRTGVSTQSTTAPNGKPLWLPGQSNLGR